MKPVSITDVLHAGSTMAGKDLRERDKHRPINAVRSAAYRAARDLTGRPFSAIGRIFHRSKGAVASGAGNAVAEVVSRVKDLVQGTRGTP